MCYFIKNIIIELKLLVIPIYILIIKKALQVKNIQKNIVI